MAGPFYNAIRGTTSGTPGTGAFTPNAAATGHIAWSTVATGWSGLVRFDDGTAWEMRYCYWNGTTISRPSNIVSSSTGSTLTLSSAATAAMVIDASKVQPRLASVSERYYIPLQNAGGTWTAIGLSNPTIIGGSSKNITGGATFIEAQPRGGFLSATTANAQCGFVPPISTSNHPFLCSTTAGAGGWELAWRFGVELLPTGPRLFMGANWLTFVANTGEPSAFTGKYAVFGKDSTDTNIQIMTNNNTGGATKIDTGIPLVVGGWYDGAIWQNPGSLTTYFLLIRVDTGEIYYGSTATDVPPNNSVLQGHFLAGLSATTGTALDMSMGTISFRSGA